RLCYLVDKTFAREYTGGREDGTPGPVFHRKINRHISGLNRRKIVRDIVTSPGPILVPGSVAHLLGIERRNIMKRAGFGVLPRDRHSLRIESSRQIMDGGRLKMAMFHIVDTRPEKLHRRFGCAGDIGRFDRIIDCEAPAKPTTNHGDVYVNIRWRNAEKFGDFPL